MIGRRTLTQAVQYWERVVPDCRFIASPVVRAGGCYLAVIDWQGERGDGRAQEPAHLLQVDQGALADVDLGLQGDLQGGEEALQSKIEVADRRWHSASFPVREAVAGRHWQLRPIRSARSSWIELLSIKDNKFEGD